jgi:hypothetical protein
MQVASRTAARTLRSIVYATNEQDAVAQQVEDDAAAVAVIASGSATVPASKQQRSNAVQDALAGSSIV